MSQAVDKYISENNLVEALSECLRTNQFNTGLLLAKIWIDKNPKLQSLYKQLNNSVNGIEKDDNEIFVIEDTGKESNPPVVPVRLLMLCNWTDSKGLCDSWNKMSKGDYTWNNIQMVWEEPADYYVIINSPPPDASFDPKRTILFRMEPHMDQHPEMWEDWANPNVDDFMFVGYHSQHYNNNEWHLSRTYNQLLHETIEKNKEVANILSTILSDKYKDPGHIKRIDFAKFLEQKELPIHVYGGNKFLWKNYKGSLPPGQKDDALYPYKYTFNVENFPIRGYYTEKLIDSILSECLCVYHGCPNIRDYIDDRAYVWLELSNFEEDYKKIHKMIEEDWWSERIDVIRSEKKRILNELQFFPRVESILNSL